MAEIYEVITEDRDLTEEECKALNVGDSVTLEWNHPVAPKRLAIAFPDDDGFKWYEYVMTGNVLFLGEAPDPDPASDTTPDTTQIKANWSDIGRYSQNDPRWRDLEYAGGTTFGAAGCFVVCVAIMAQASEPDALLTPPEVARALRDAGAFNGNLLSNLENVPVAFPEITLKSPETRGAIHYRDKAADMQYIASEMENGPLIAEVAFDPRKPVTWVDADGKRHWNQHFVLIVSADADNDTAMIADPWDGELKEITASRYALGGWKASRIITGLRLVRLA